jgi:hypothetical protein
MFIHSHCADEDIYADLISVCDAKFAHVVFSGMVDHGIERTEKSMIG